MQLSQHFSLAELTHSNKADALGLSNEATSEVVEALFDTALMLENVREHLAAVAGKPIPITVTSGYRSHEVNRAVGSSDTSDHVRGMAADIVAPAFGSPYAIACELAAHMDALGIGQMIVEGLHGKRWLHLSTAVPVKAINRVLTITDDGTVPGLKETA